MVYLIRADERAVQWGSIRQLYQYTYYTYCISIRHSLWPTNRSCTRSRRYENGMVFNASCHGYCDVRLRGRCVHRESTGPDGVGNLVETRFADMHAVHRSPRNVAASRRVVVARWVGREISRPRKRLRGTSCWCGDVVVGSDTSGGLATRRRVAGFPGRADAGSAIATATAAAVAAAATIATMNTGTIAEAPAVAWAPDSGFKEIAENARKRRFQFPENRGNNGNRVERVGRLAPPPCRDAAVSTRDYYSIFRNWSSANGRTRGGQSPPAVGWYPGTIARISSAKCDPPSQPSRGGARFPSHSPRRHRLVRGRRRGVSRSRAFDTSPQTRHE